MVLAGSAEWDTYDAKMQLDGVLKTSGSFNVKKPLRNAPVMEPAFLAYLTVIPEKYRKETKIRAFLR